MPSPAAPRESGERLDDLAIESERARDRTRASPLEAPGERPVALTPDAPVPPESPTRDDQAGVTLDVVFRARRAGSPPTSPDVSVVGENAALRATSWTSSIDLTAAGRMRWVVTSHAMPFPFRTELRSRRDRMGHLLLWHNDASYRVLGPGALRTALDEGRVDVAPLASGSRTSTSSGARLGEPTRVVTLLSGIGQIRLEVANVPEAARGGPLLCRALVELAGIDPSTPECRDDEVALHASIGFFGPAGDTKHGPIDDEPGIDFDVTNVAKRTDIAPSVALCPPQGAELKMTGLPDVPPGSFLTHEEMSALRLPGAHEIGKLDDLLLRNDKDRLFYFFIDGLPVAALPPSSTRVVSGARKSTYAGLWRTFLGERVEPAKTFSIPGNVSIGEPSSGANGAGG